jgi:hypothetical protein
MDEVGNILKVLMFTRYLFGLGVQYVRLCYVGL